MHKLLVNDTVMLIQPVLVKHFGRAGAQLLSQLHYWLTKKETQADWVYNTAEEWAEQLQLSVRHVRRLIAKFVDLGIVKVAKLSKIKTDRTNYYSIDYDCLAELIADKMSPSPCQNDSISIQKLPNKDFNNSFEKEKVKPAQAMLKIWTESLGEKAEAKLSKELAPLLVAAFKTKFESNLTNWQSYCEQIKSSAYLMGESFTLNLTWALKFKTIERIRAGDFGVKVLSLAATPLDDSKIHQMIEDLQESAAYTRARQQIAKAIGYRMYYSWFHGAEFCEISGKIRLKAPNEFVRQYWETHFAWVVRDFI